MTKIDKTDLENLNLLKKEFKIKNIQSVKIKKGNTEVTNNPQIFDCGKIIRINQKGITPIFNHK